MSVLVVIVVAAVLLVGWLLAEWIADGKR